ncbi:MAG: hypothetical protein ONB46_15335 [candidate division KSB1 bacterium]|nr:hypothetical protein [candidate division KSB1 bacterium]MDZ7367091.1 hypothetical protein [candidate division KSB1 bacterium]MDZ7405069.1 hypothetical protein [candidate division KSB1 bacterium]
MKTIINEDVDVLARTEKGKLNPVLVTWKGKNYTVQRIESRKKMRAKRNRFETITVKVIVSNEMNLEFDHVSKSWRLLTVSHPLNR